MATTPSTDHRYSNSSRLIEPGSVPVSGPLLIESREARIAAARAARSGWAEQVEVETTLADLRSGDYLVVVPTQEGVRGQRFGCTVEIAESRWDQWQRRAGRRSEPIAAVVVHPADRRLAVVSYPAHFRCTVRRSAAGADQ